MVVYNVTNAPQRIRGLISRYCIELRPGLYVGRLDKRMRLKLWDAIQEGAKAKTSAIMAWSCPTDQGYAIKSLGPTAHLITKIDGIFVSATNGAEPALETKAGDGVED